MESLQRSFDELRSRLKHRHSFDHAVDDPVYYLVFRPEEMLEVKKSMRKWNAKLNLDGWSVDTFSMAEAVKDILKKNELRDVWLESEKDDPFEFDSINKTLAEALTGNNALQLRLNAKLQSLKGEAKTVLFVTDLEALHPYLRVGTLEQRLQGSFTVPTIILYPGIRSGRTTLRFLGIYPEDGNYRSIHIGG